MRNKEKEGRSRKLKVRSLVVGTLLSFIFSLSNVSAQTSLNASGGNASGSGGSAGYSVGQVAYQTHTGTNGSAAEGVQQPYEISVVTGIGEAKGITLSVKAYPNPTTDHLTLEVNDFELSTLRFQLYDMQGKLLQTERITGNQTSIVMSHLTPAAYFLKVVRTQGIVPQQEVKTFKIIKTQ
jgi:hypothetical protein